ncbi:MAG: hypothetical protein P1U43_14325 [Maricaulis sp.]|nr:hypothetical protein [Maricaulis sp.]MDF1769924.1 hypothetical protein [Maricaulis sp.]
MIERPFFLVGPPCRNEASAALPVGMDNGDDRAAFDEANRYFAKFAIVHSVIDDCEDRSVKSLDGFLEAQLVLGDIRRVLR